MNETNMVATIALFEKLNLTAAGYRYVNLDDCWSAKQRAADGSLVADPQRFPRGIAFLADLAHSKGVGLGIYTDRGEYTCQQRPGSYGHEAQDAKTFASWGIDYVKEDSCFASPDHATAFAEYAKMRDALNATGRPILLSLCGWHSWYAPVGKSLGNSWRISGDVNSYDDMKRAIDVNSMLASYAGAGGFNDPDMLLGSSPGSAVKLTPHQSRAQFSLWSVMAAPLLIGASLSHLSAYDLETYTNKEVIRISQDPLSRQGIRIAGGNLTGGATFNVWARPLTDGSSGVVFLNAHLLFPATVTCDATCFTAGGWHSVSVRDLWSHTELGNFTGSFSAKSLPPRGGSATFLFRPL
jgi:alpha-galactosidase